MSYCFEMAFKKCSSYAKALEYASNYVYSITMTEMQYICKDNSYYLPFNRWSVENTDERLIEAVKQINSYYLENLLSFRFVYFPEKKLLAIVGGNYPRADKYFDKSIYFQNSCDQDYEVEEWGKTKYFKQVWDKIFNLTDEEFINLVKTEGKDWWDIDEMSSDPDKLKYLRRSFVYDTIFKELDLENWLYSNNYNINSSEKYKCFSINRLYKYEEAMDLNRWCCNYFNFDPVKPTKK